MRRASPVCLLLAAIFVGCNSSSQQLLEQAEARWREGQYEDAVRLNTLLYQRDPGSPLAAQALLNLGNIEYLNLRRVRNAIDYYKQITEEFPGSPEALSARVRLASIYTDDVGDLTQAIVEYDLILERSRFPRLENRAELEVRRANAYFLIGDLDRAQRELQRLEDTGLTGELADQVRLKIGNIYQMRKKYEEAAAYFSRVSGALCLECRRRALIHLSESYEALYDFDRAIETLRKLERTPENNRLIDREVVRLSEKRRSLDTAAGLKPQSSVQR